MYEDWRTILAALYLPGSPHSQHLDRRRWPAILGALRSLGLEAPTAEIGLRSKGLISESIALGAGNSLDWAKRLEPSQFLTCLDEAYPDRWLAVLKDQAPPVGWFAGTTAKAMPCLGIVGSREVESFVHRFCGEVARCAVDLGFRVVSGGAVGCDQTALQAAVRYGGSALTIRPYGIGLAENVAEGAALFSVCEPDEVFSRSRAMERNALIYAAGRFTVVGQVRFREGGTWHGATAAIRRGTTQVLVRKPGSNEADEVVRGAKALVALGALYLEEPGQLEDHCRAPTLDHGLFAGLKAG